MITEFLGEVPNRLYVPGFEDNSLRVDAPAEFEEEFIAISGFSKATLPNDFIGWLKTNERKVPYTWQYPGEPITYIEREDARQVLGHEAITALCGHPDDLVRSALLQNVALDIVQFMKAWKHPDFLPEQLRLAAMTQVHLWNRWRPAYLGKDKSMAQTRFGATTVYKIDLFSKGQYPTKRALPRP